MGSAPVMALLCVLAGLVAIVAYQCWFARRCQRRIRRWADRNGYAILRLGRRRFPARLFVLATNWRITIQDQQGGWRTATVCFGYWLIDVPWGKMIVHWE